MKDLTIEQLKNSRAFQQKDYWVAPAYYMSNGVLGGYIFNTEDEANNSITGMISRLESKEKYAAQELEAKRKEEAAHAEMIASYGSFLSSEPKKRGLQLKVMERIISNNGVISTRKQMIERKIFECYELKLVDSYKSVRGSGYLVRDGNKTEWALVKDGYTLSLNVTEREYAEYVLNISAAKKV